MNAFWAILSGLGMIAGGGGAGYLCGYVTAIRKKRATQPICPCGHTIGEHTDDDGCQAEIRRVNYWESGSRNGKQWVQCACLKYWGPQPLTELFHPGTYLPNDVN